MPLFPVVRRKFGDTPFTVAPALSEWSRRGRVLVMAPLGCPELFLVLVTTSNSWILPRTPPLGRWPHVDANVMTGVVLGS